MKNKNLETLIYEMLSRQNKMMIDEILPRLERLDTIDVSHADQLDQLNAAVLAQGQDLATLARELYTLKTGKNINPTPNGESL